MSKTKNILQLSDNFFEIGRMIASLEKKAHTYGTKHTLFSNEVHTLKIIAENEGINQKELTEKMMRTKGATSMVLDKLVAKNLVIKKPNANDMRIYNLYLTEDGKSVNKHHNEYDVGVASSWINATDISNEDIEITNRTIEKCIKYYKEIYLAQNK